VKATCREGAGLRFDLCNKLLPRLFGGQSRNAFELLEPALARLVDLRLLAGSLLVPRLSLIGDRLFFFANTLFAILELRDLAIDRLFFLLDATLNTFNLFPSLDHFTIELISKLDRFILRRECRVSSLFLRLGQNDVRLLSSDADP
jgi:hypothetical protein